MLMCTTSFAASEEDGRENPNGKAGVVRLLRCCGKATSGDLDVSLQLQRR